MLLVRAFAAGVLRVRPDPAAAVVPILIDVNRAGLGELLALPGLGPARAEAIILHRVRHGPFRTIDELDAVDGIGPETLLQLRPFVRVAAAPPPDRDPERPGR